MIKDLKRVKIGSLWNEGRGATYKEELLVEPDFGHDIVLKSPLKADLMLIRMKDSIMTVLENINFEAEMSCARCLEPFVENIDIASTEREFLEEQPSKNYDPFEVFLINRDEMCLDLTEMVRQEIILHFPMIPVCSERCRGLCPGCKINLNHQEKHRANCTGQENPSEVDQHKPFAKLKELFKSQENN